MERVNTEIKTKPYKQYEVKEESKKGKWAIIADKIRNEGLFTGKSEEVNKVLKEVRTGIAF